ncbi:MAG: hypothetical protein PHF86_12950 [Candidatus Nanoarchaeia archaeon]|nr:hypothetical protein [Candidatus Nanoarchaeia archaeon]
MKLINLKNRKQCYDQFSVQYCSQVRKQVESQVLLQVYNLFMSSLYLKDNLLVKSRVRNTVIYQVWDQVVYNVTDQINETK